MLSAAAVAGRRRPFLAITAINIGVKLNRRRIALHGCRFMLADSFLLTLLLRALSEAYRAR